MKNIHNFRQFNESVEEDFLKSQDNLKKYITKAEQILDKKITDPVEAVTELYDLDDPESIELAKNIEDEIDNLDKKTEQIDR